MRLILMSLILLVASLSLADDKPRELTPFTTDGCSWSPDGTLREPLKFRNCCKMHDFEYWLGGTEDQRLQADQEFKQCLLDSGASRFRARSYFRAVRIFGGPRGCSYCWGYGWSPRPRSYAQLSVEEETQVPEMTEEQVVSTPVSLHRKNR